MFDEPIFFTPPFQKGFPLRLFKGGGGKGKGGLLGGVVGGLIGGPLGAVLGAGMGSSAGAQSDAAKAAEKSASQAQANAEKQAKAADEATNRANTKRADTGAALDSATQAGKAGASGTMLTGPQGIDPTALNLSKNTLLGS